MRFENPICAALDTPDEETFRSLVGELAPHVGVFKVGLTAHVALGGDALREAARHRPVFLDLKLHDIPVQVAGAVRAAAATGASLLTVHASGGSAMIAAAVEAAPADVTVVAVTVLTSLSDEDLSSLGMGSSVDKQVLGLAEVAIGSGAGGLVCSPLEVGALRARLGPEPLLVVPGIRPAGASSADQKRTLGPREALEAGADLLVVGRPLTGASDPAAAAAGLLEELGG